MTGGRLPDFVIIGAQRAGTTSLFRYLGEHPDVALPGEKELHFFSYNYVVRSIEWYRRCFPADAVVTGEASPYYLFHPRAHERMAKDNPDARLIVLLRKPVERAYSHWAFARGEGLEPLEFEEAVTAEERRLAGEGERLLADDAYPGLKHQYYSYVARGRYAEQLERWFALFPRERFLILRSEDLYATPAAVYAQVLEFLGLPSWAPPTFEIFNRSDASDLPPGERARLTRAFQPDNERLAALLGRDMGWGP